MRDPGLTQEHIAAAGAGGQAARAAAPGGLRALRLLYLLYFGGLGFIYPFMNLILLRLGLTGVQIGWLGTIGAVCALVAAPVWGRWSDRHSEPKRLIQAGLLGAAACLAWLNFQQEFVWIAAALGTMALFTAGIEPLANSLVLRVTTHSDAGFGGVRLYGSLGWAVIVLLGGWLFGALGKSVAFFGAAVMYVAGALAVGTLRPLGSAPAAHEPGPGGTRQALREIGHSRALLALALCLAVVWITGMGGQQFETIYLDQLGAREWLIGLSYTIPAVIELPAMLWADRQVRQHVPAAILRTSLLVSAGAAMIVLLRPSVASVMLLRAINGVAFSMFTVSSVMLIGERAPAGHKALVMTIYIVTLYQICAIAGSPLAGWIFDAVGAYWLYAMSLLGNLAGWAILRSQKTVPEEQAALR